MRGLVGLLLAIRCRFEIDHDWLLGVAHDDPLRDCVGRIEFLVGHERRDVNEVAGLHIFHEFEVVAPANLRMPGVCGVLLSNWVGLMTRTVRVGSGVEDELSIVRASFG